jgi:peptidoglycan/LPS O-acetylase OafA/YrhL
MSERATWAVVTFALLVAWSVAVAIAVAVFTDWSTSVKTLVAIAIASPGAVLILAVRMRGLPPNRVP